MSNLTALNFRQTIKDFQEALVGAKMKIYSNGNKFDFENDF